MCKSKEDLVLWQVTLRIIPFIGLLYFVSFIDRVNIGFAALQMSKDLGFTPAVFGFGAGVFFVGYLIFEIPSNIIMRRVGARMWISRIMITWGLISASMIFIRGEKSLYFLRFLLGVAEAGFFPGIIFYLTLWFPKRKLAEVMALFGAAVPLSTALGSPISGAILSVDHAFGLSAWQLLFLIEAVPAIVLGFLVLIYLTDRPEEAYWLSDDQRDWLVSTMTVDQADKVGTVKLTIWGGIADIRVALLSMIYFGSATGIYTVNIWSPQIIKEFGVSDLTVGLLNAIPAVVACFGSIFWGRHSDTHNERTWHLAGACFLAAVGSILSGMASTVLMIVLALTIVSLGISSSKPTLWAIPPSFLTGAGAATGFAMINSVGNLGGLVGPWITGVLKGRTSSFMDGMYLLAAFMLISSGLAFVVGKLQTQRASTEFG